MVQPRARQESRVRLSRLGGGQAACSAIIPPGHGVLSRPGAGDTPPVISAPVNLPSVLASPLGPARLITLLACAAPLFALTIRSWTNAVLLVASAAAVLLFLSRKAGPAPSWGARDLRDVKLVALCLAAPILATAWSASLRGHWSAPDYDAPVRLCLAIPIALLAARARFDAHAALRFVLPLGLVFTLLQLKPQRWGSLREATSFADPLAVGYVSLACALMCLASLEWRALRVRPAWETLLKLLAVVLGLYISMRSGSRTGWLAVPLVFAGWILLQARGARPGTFVAALVLAVVATASAYLLSGQVQQRVDLAVAEVTDYEWDGVAQGTSVGARITYLRIGADLLAMHPWTGLGDTSKLVPNLSAFPYSAPDVVQTAYSSGMHNQVLSNAVRTGIPGLVATLLLLLVPLYVCAARLRDPDRAVARNAAMGTAYFVTMGVSSLSTEIVDLKYAASLYAVMVAVLCGSVLGTARPSTPAPAPIA